MFSIVLPNSVEKIRVKFQHNVPAWTRCFLVAPNDEVIVEGFALCSSMDNFKRETGRKLSLARAMKNAGFDRETRIMIWDRYFVMKIIGHNKKKYGVWFDDLQPPLEDMEPSQEELNEMDKIAVELEADANAS